MDGHFLVLLVFLSTFVIPAFAIMMMRFLGLISSIEMEDKQERIGPYIVTGIFYLWMFRNLLDNPDIPTAYKIFVLGATIALFVAFFINNFSKISLHAVGMGGLVAMVLITTLQYSYGSFLLNTLFFGYIEVSMISLLLMSILLTGIVGTSRLILKAHELQDISGGVLVGFASMLVAMYFLT